MALDAPALGIDFPATQETTDRESCQTKTSQTEAELRWICPATRFTSTFPSLNKFQTLHFYNGTSLC
jgi:hypothetical protein